MTRKPKLDKNINKDVVLCETTNHRVSNRTIAVLLQDSIAFTKNWKRVPFYKREAYQGASEVCVISINRNEYVQARRSIQKLERNYRDRLLLNVI